MKQLIILILCVTAFSSIDSNAQLIIFDRTKNFSIADSASFKGKFKFEGLPFEYVEVIVQDNKLYVTGGGYDGVLEPTSDRKYVFNVNGVATFTFICDNKQKIAELKIDYNSQSFVGKKEGYYWVSIYNPYTLC